MPPPMDDHGRVGHPTRSSEPATPATGPGHETASHAAMRAPNNHIRTTGVSACMRTSPAPHAGDARRGHAKSGYTMCGEASSRLAAPTDAQLALSGHRSWPAARVTDRRPLPAAAAWVWPSGLLGLSPPGMEPARSTVTAVTRPANMAGWRDLEQGAPKIARLGMARLAAATARHRPPPAPRSAPMCLHSRNAPFPVSTCTSSRDAATAFQADAMR